MQKFILQHIGKTSKTNFPLSKISEKEIDEAISSGKINISGTGNLKISYGEKTIDITKINITKLVVPEILYANKYEDPEAHFLRGIIWGKNILEIKHLITEKEEKKLLNIFPNKIIYFWGLKNGEKNRTKRKIRKIKIGDKLILLGTFGVEAVCEIAYISESKKLGLALWRNSDYENIIFVKNINRFPNLDIKELKTKLNLSYNYNKISAHIVDEGPGYAFLVRKID